MSRDRYDWEASDEPLRQERVRPNGGPSRPSSVSARQSGLLADPSAFKR
jgi:hypothetical protein